MSIRQMAARFATLAAEMARESPPSEVVAALGLTLSSVIVAARLGKDEDVINHLAETMLKSVGEIRSDVSH